MVRSIKVIIYKSATIVDMKVFGGSVDALQCISQEYIINLFQCTQTMAYMQNMINFNPR